MKPILIKVTEPITIEKVQECVDKAYEAGVEDGKRENHYGFISTTTPKTIPLTQAVPCTGVSNIEFN